MSSKRWLLALVVGTFLVGSVRTEPGDWRRIGKPGDWKGTVAGAVLNGRVYTVERNGCLYETDPDTGAWKQLGRPEFGNTAFLFAVGERLLSIETDGSMYEVEVGTAKVSADRVLGERVAIASSGTQPRYTIESKVAKRVTAVYRGELRLTGITPEEWWITTTAAPELPSQRGVKTTVDPAAEQVREQGGEERSLLIGHATVDKPTPDPTLPFRITYEATLMARRLVPVKPGERVRPVAPLAKEERERYLAATYTLDFEVAPFQEWLDQNHLRRAKNEDDVDFGRRVFKAMLKQYTYEKTRGEKVSELCKAQKADCDTLSSVFTAAMRANGVPARVLIGYLAKSKQPDADGKISGHGVAEFFADGVGWVPVDLAFALTAPKGKDPMTQFGQDPGKMVVQFVDSDIMVPALRGPRRIYGLQVPVARVKGKTTGKIEVKPVSWTVGPVPETRKATDEELSEQPGAPPADGKGGKDSRLTQEGLGEMLQNFGYEPTAVKSEDGLLTWYRVIIDQEDFHYVVLMCVLPSEGKLRILVPVGTVAEVEKVPADRLWKLLEENGKIAPMAFYFYPGAKQLYLSQYVENRDLTPVRVRKELDAVLRVTRRTYALWDTTKWPGGPAPKPAATADEKGKEGGKP